MRRGLKVSSSERTGGAAPSPEKVALVLVCSECGAHALVPFKPPGGKRWSGPKSWFDVFTPALKAVGWACSVSQTPTGEWVTCTLCPSCIAKVLDVAKDEVPGIMREAGKLDDEDEN